MNSSARGAPKSAHKVNCNKIKAFFFFIVKPKRERFRKEIEENVHNSETIGKWKTRGKGRTRASESDSLTHLGEEARDR